MLSTSTANVPWNAPPWKKPTRPPPTGRSGLIDLYKPDEEESSSLAEEFGLHPLAVRDAIEAHQRPKLERYGKTLFIVLKPAYYLDESETVEFSEAHVFMEEDFVITVRHGEAGLGRGATKA